MAVGPGRVQPGRGSRVVEQGRLRQQDIGAFSVAPFTRRALGFGDLLERAAEVQRRRALAIGGRPGDRAVEGPVELEDSRAVPVPAERTGVVGRKAIAGDSAQLARDDVGEDDIGARQVVDRARGVNLAAELLEPIGQCIREALRPRPREAPSEDMGSGDQEQADAPARPRLQREHGVRRVAGEEGSGALRPEALREAVRAREPGAGEGEVDRVQETVRPRQERTEDDRLVVAPARHDAVHDLQVGAATFLEPSAV